MDDKSTEDLMQEIVYELKTITSISVLTCAIVSITMILFTGVILFIK
jgi:hypothetical protein